MDSTVEGAGHSGGRRRVSERLRPLVCLVLLAACSRAEIDAGQLAEVGGVFHDRTTGQAFTGEVTGAIEGRLRDGRWQGVVRTYHPDGSKQSEARFRGGVMQDAARSWHANGQLASLVEYADGARHGAFSRWFDNGVTEVEKTFDDDRESGHERRYLRNGRLLLDRTWRAGRKHGVETYFCWPDASPGANFGGCGPLGEGVPEPVAGQGDGGVATRTWCYQDNEVISREACAELLTRSSDR